MTPPITLLALHGFTLNGERMRAQLGDLPTRLGPEVKLLCPDAPNPCTAETVERMYRKWGTRPLPPPHRCWWTANDDGSEYVGWAATRSFLTELLAEERRVLVLGFSQGASLAATLAALSTRGEYPMVLGVVCIAGSVPRALELKRYFEAPIARSSLHVWGERDPVSARSAPVLAERFVEPEVCPWRGSHTIPVQGAAADAIVRFVARQRVEH